MMNYGELFQELYTQKYIEQNTSNNMIEKVQLFQRKIKESPVVRKYGTDPQGFPLTFNRNLEEISDEPPKRIIREVVPKKKMMKARENPFLKMNSKQQNYSYSPEKTDFHFSKIEHPAFSQTHRVLISSPHHSKKNSMIVSSAHKSRNLESSETQKRAKTPSKKVIIGGRNLEKEAEVYRREFRKLDIEMERYHKKTQEESLEKRRLSIRSQRKSRNSIKRESLRTKKQGRKSKLQKEENVELLPWSVMAEHEYY